MMIQRAYKTELDPNDEQARAIARHCGAARFVFNWGLDRKIKDYEQGAKSRGGMALDKELRALKGSDPAFTWLQEISSQCRQSALANLDRAYKNFFDRCKKGATKKGFPRFKSRWRDKASFRVYGCAATETHVRLPVIGWVKLKERGYIPTTLAGNDGVTVSERAGRWFVSVQVETEIPDANAAGLPSAGVDLGIKALATVSDGTVIENPKALRRAQRKLKRLQRAVSRKQKGSANRRKAVTRLAKAHARVSDVRSDATHKTTTILAKTKSAIVLEDLNVRGMMSNHALAGAVADANFGEFRRQVTYKANWYGSKVVIAGRWLPTSKTCSQCGCVKESLSLSERVYHCDECGSEMDRDLNAAINLNKLAASQTESLNACGGERYIESPSGDSRCSPVKQESMLVEKLACGSYEGLP